METENHRKMIEMVDRANCRVIGIDPGGTTGWATFSAYRYFDYASQSYEYEDVEWTCGQLGPEKHHQALEQLLGLQRVEYYTIVCERFTDRVTGHSVDLTAREYIGVIQKYCQEDKVPLVMQMSAQAKGFTNSKNLRKLGLYYAKDKHAMDAYKHVLWYLIHGQPKMYSLLETGWPNG
jgi:hypothetical protein